ncbi:unnamed protein product [Dicrocoelium dendriticum]|nr:unnamed protein product [Dicrocoelium dendriticum]
MVVCRTLPGLFSLLPFLSMAISFCDFSKTAVQSAFGAPGTLRSVRAFAGPLLSPDAHSFRSKWLKVNSSSSYKEFASVRLSDPDKGYERQGRFIARVFGTQWFEYWDFLDDYLDLSSEHGLSVLDERLRKDMSPGNKLWCCLEQDNAKCLRDVDSRTVLKFETASPSTPISRQVVHLPDNTNSQWHTYRSHPICATLLDDSLDASGDTPSPRALSDDEVRVAQNEVTETTNTLSPLLGLLRKLTFASPLRWLLVDGPGNSEPIFDPQSALPPHKKPVKMSTPVIDATRHSGKRRLSAVDRNQPPLEHTEQPAVKKSSPSGKASIRKSCFVPPLLKHIYRALPSGDPELEKAVMAVSSNKHDGDSVSLFSESQIGCFHYANLSNFRTVVAWRERMEAFIHFPRRHM